MNAAAQSIAARSSLLRSSQCGQFFTGYVLRAPVRTYKLLSLNLRCSSIPIFPRHCTSSSFLTTLLSSHSTTPTPTPTSSQGCRRVQRVGVGVGVVERQLYVADMPGRGLSSPVVNYQSLFLMSVRYAVPRRCRVYFKRGFQPKCEVQSSICI